MASKSISLDLSNGLLHYSLAKLVVPLLLIVASLYGVRAVFRLYLHPLSKFAGPTAAALSNRWLYKVSKTGQQEEEFEKLHKVLGTQALRIGPNELHITDPSLYKTIYSQSRPYAKESNFYTAFNLPHEVFTELDIALHQERRRLLNPLFSRSSVLKISDIIQKHALQLRSKLTSLSEEKKAIHAHNAFRCVTVDIIGEFAFDQDRSLVIQSNDRFDTDYLAAFDAAAAGIWDLVFNPAVLGIANMLPQRILFALIPPVQRIWELRMAGAEAYHTYKTSRRSKAKSLMFDNLTHLPEDDVVSEALGILVAGSDTTAFTVLAGAWNLARKPMAQLKLARALKDTFPNPSDLELPKLKDLEEVPFLKACVKESLRVGMAVPGRLPRIVPGGSAAPLVVDGKVVPPGTIVGMSAYTMHYDESLWGEDAREFNPERWLNNAQPSLDHNLVTFSKAARSCLGQNLAQAELYTLFFVLFRHFELEIDPTTDGTLPTRDYFTRATEEPGVLLRARRIA